MINSAFIWNSLFSEFPIFPDHFSVQSTAPPYYNCIKIDQPRDREWGTRYLCYKPALKNFNIKWSNDGPITGHDCVNTIMPYERNATIWANSFLCVPQSSVLRLIWSTRPLNRRKCLAMRERRSYLLCGELKYGKIGNTECFNFSYRGRSLSIHTLSHSPCPILLTALTIPYVL